MQERMHVHPRVLRPRGRGPAGEVAGLGNDILGIHVVLVPVSARWNRETWDETEVQRNARLGSAAAEVAEERPQQP
jgi:hypothetical protein